MSDDSSMIELFRAELAKQASVLTEGLSSLSGQPDRQGLLTVLMRATHSIKGAARLVGFEGIVTVAHAAEDVLAAVQKGAVDLGEGEIDLLLESVDVMQRLADASSAPAGDGSAIERIVAALNRLVRQCDAPDAGAGPAAGDDGETPGRHDTGGVQVGAFAESDRMSATMRISASRLDNLLRLAADARVQSQWLAGFTQSMGHLGRVHHHLINALDEFRDRAISESIHDAQLTMLADIQQQANLVRQQWVESLSRLHAFVRQSATLTRRLHGEILATRLQPFGESLQTIPRMVRELARTLNKEVKVEMSGMDVLVDREIVEKIQIPLTHLIHNAVDHGIESPAQRRRRGKPQRGVLSIRAEQERGLLHLTLGDDGAGIDPQQLADTIAQRGLMGREKLSQLSSDELFDFLFLPGFTTRTAVTAVSGRGVGLDVVRDVLREIQGSISIVSEPGHGTTFHLHLPVSRSVLLCLIVTIAGQCYALPMTRIEQILRCERQELAVDGEGYFIVHESQRVPVVALARILELSQDWIPPAVFDALVLRGHGRSCAVAVEQCLGQREVTVQPVPALLGKVPDVNAAAMLEDGSPLFILDADDLLYSAVRLRRVGRGSPLTLRPQNSLQRSACRVLVVDDSATVRRLLQRLLNQDGYAVTPVDSGAAAWARLQDEWFDLVVTDIDMPAMGGIELIERLRRRRDLARIPVMVLSYKNDHMHRNRAFQAGADFFLAKSRFHETAFRDAVARLLGTVGGR